MDNTKIEMLKKARRSFLKYVEGSEDKSNGAATLSNFWRRVHNRSQLKTGEIYLPEEEIMNLGKWANESRNMGLAPITKGKKAIGAYKNWFKSSVRRLKNSPMPKSFVNSLKENDFLQNDSHKFKGDGLENPHSGYFMLNSASAYDIDQVIKKYLKKESLEIAEIGSGLGGVSDILMQTNKVKNYTYIDLAPTALLGMLNILYSHDKEYELIEKNSQQTAPLCWAIPENLSFIKGQFDVIINISSLQEMSRDNVNTYIDWIKDHLKPNGIFVSINNHTPMGKKDIKEIRNFSEFRFHEFEILELKSYWRQRGQNPYMCIMKKSLTDLNYDVEALDRETTRIVRRQNIQEANEIIEKIIKK